MKNFKNINTLKCFFNKAESENQNVESNYLFNRNLFNFYAFTTSQVYLVVNRLQAISFNAVNLNDLYKIESETT